MPAAAFYMGGDEGAADEQPVRVVQLTGFELDRHEVTNARYRACVEAGRCTKPQLASSRTRPHYFDLASYADYPTEAFRTIIECESGAPVANIIERIVELNDLGLLPVLEKIAAAHHQHWEGKAAQKAIRQLTGKKPAAPTAAPTKVRETAYERRVGNPYNYADQAAWQWRRGHHAEALRMWRDLARHEEGAPLSHLIATIVAQRSTELNGLLQEIGKQHGGEAWLKQEISYAKFRIRESLTLE